MWCVCVHRVGLAVLLASAVVSSADTDKSLSRSGQDAALHSSLKDVINTGADLYNGGDWAGCYRLFQGALLSVHGSLAHKPELQKLIKDRLNAAKDDPLMWRRAFTLREVLDKIREDVGSQKSLAKPDPVKPKEPDQTVTSAGKEEKSTGKKEPTKGIDVNPFPPPSAEPREKPVKPPVSQSPPQRVPDKKVVPPADEIEKIKTKPQVDDKAKLDPDDL